MPETTQYISKINLKGTTYTIKDANATSAISGLSTKVTAAQTDISNIKKLSRLTASYDSATETLNIAEETHA